jgi:hypothetical protein
MYVLVRTDLPPPQRAVQACHAVLEARHFISEDDDHPHLVLCGVADLLALQEAVATIGQDHAVFIEADIGDEPTAAAFKPVRGPDRRPFRKLKLLEI